MDETDDLADRFSTTVLANQSTNGEAQIAENISQLSSGENNGNHQSTNGEAQIAENISKLSNGENLSKSLKGRKWFTTDGSKKLLDFAEKGIKKALITVKTMRRILNFKESILKYGVFVPRNDKEADDSPERVRWDSGRMLE